MLLSLSSLYIILGLTHSILSLNLLNKSFTLLFDIGLKLLRHVFKISRFSNPDPRVEILKHIAYESQGAISFSNRDPEILFLENINMEIARIFRWIIFDGACNNEYIFHDDEIKFVQTNIHAQTVKRFIIIFKVHLYRRQDKIKCHTFWIR